MLLEHRTLAEIEAKEQKIKEREEKQKKAIENLKQRDKRGHEVYQNFFFASHDQVKK